jgi:hypothetical protein
MGYRPLGNCNEYLYSAVWYSDDEEDETAIALILLQDFSAATQRVQNFPASLLLRIVAVSVTGTVNHDACCPMSHCRFR